MHARHPAPRSLSPSVVWLTLLLLPGAVALAFRAPDTPVKPDLDVRLPATEAGRGGFLLRTPTAAQTLLAESLAARLPGVVLSWDGMSGSPKWISAAAGATLAPPSTGTPEEIARGYLRAHAGLFGLLPREIDDLRFSGAVLAREGDAHVHFVQTAAGLEIFDSSAIVNLLPDGSVLSAGSQLFAGPRLPAVVPIAPADALRAAVADVYPNLLFTADIVSPETGGERRVVFDGTGFGRPPEAKLVLFPDSDGARLAWRVRVAEQTFWTDWEVVVDAMDASILLRRNLTRYASARVLQAGFCSPHSEEFAPAEHQLVSIPSSTPQSPNGWINAPGTTLAGNNSTGHMFYLTEPGLSETTGIYDYPYNTTESALVNVWWWANDAHDRFYAAGFNEAAGNFQVSNFGLGGLGGDPMKVVSWTMGGRNNAFTAVDADGTAGSINFFWVACRFCGDHDGYPENGGERAAGFMRDVVVHEFAHGVSTRLVGGPANARCLTGVQSAGMGEGWSDLFAASFYDDPVMGGSFFEGNGWMRDLRNDLTYANLCGVGDRGCQVHDDGMIWGATLWDLRSSMIALDPAGGLTAFHRIVVKGLASTTCHPTFINARDAILSADTTLYGSSHHRVIWNVFASRQMGQGASSTGENDTNPVKSSTVPTSYSCTAPSTPTGVTASPDGTNGIRIDYTATGASALEVWREDLDNSLDRPVRIAFTTSLSSTRDGTVSAGKTYRYHLIALGSGGITCRSAASATAQATATGSCAEVPRFDPALAVSDGAASCTLTLSWAAAQQGCPGSSQPVVYNVYRATNPGFEPSERLMIGRTASTTFQDEPPQDGKVYYYLVLAQHGTLSDPADHRARGISQVMKWVPRLPTLGRTVAQSWDFDSTTNGWTATNTNDPNGAWTWTDPNPTRYADQYLNPDLCAGGGGKCWITGDQAGVSSTAKDCDGTNSLASPTFDGTSGRTIFSFDYYAHMQGNFSGGLELQINNGTTTVSVRPVGFLGTQPFDTASDRGWQRAELDLSSYVTPTATMKVTFVGRPGNPLSEFGIDNVKVEQASVCGRSALRISSVVVGDSAPGWGNGNGALDPGETARLTVQLANDGTVAATLPTGELSSRTPGLLIHEPGDTFPTIPAAGTGSSLGGGFTVTLPAQGGCGGTVVLDFRITDAAGTVTYATWNLETGRLVTDTVFSDTFDTDKGWTTSGAGTGKGVWQRGDPVGTFDGSNAANPESDSTSDAGTFCYVTENGPVGGGVNANDVDSTTSTLFSPLINLGGYKRARLKNDLWYYDNSGSDLWQDYADYGAYINDGFLDYYWSTFYQADKTSGWTAKTNDLGAIIPMTSSVRLYFEATDCDAAYCGGSATDSIVEAGVDNVRVEADMQVCDSLGVTDPPNSIGGSLRVASSGTADITWTASPVDGSHSAAAYYELFVSGSSASGFSVDDTVTGLVSSRPLTGPSEYYLLTAVNAAGTSGDEP